MIYGICIGLVLGALLMNLAVEEERRKRFDAEKRAVTHFENVNKLETLNKDLQEENVILLENASEYRKKIVDLENTVEFLIPKLPKKIRELVRPGNQN